MIVEYAIEKRKVPFRNVTPSDVFEFDEDFFIKLYDTDVTFNAVCLETGVLCTFERDDEVKWLPKAKLVIE